MTEISKATLGRKRKEYENLAKIEGITEDDIIKRMTEDSKIFGVELENYQSQIEALKKPARTGKREVDHQTRDNLVIETQDFLAPVNTAIQYQRGDIKLTPKQIIATFEQIAITATHLTDDLISAFDGLGGLTMFYAPCVIDKSKPKLLSTHIAGWNDNSKTPRYQYSPRKIAVFKRSGYRDDSLDIPVFEIANTPEGDTPEVIEPVKTKKHKKHK